jgi:hypothetical protein
MSKPPPIYFFKNFLSNDIEQPGLDEQYITPLGGMAI